MEHELDDALIYQRYVKNAINGEGLVYNPGEYVNGLTSPLFGYLLLLTTFIVGDAQVSIVLLCAVITAIAAVITMLLTAYARDSDTFWPPLVAAMLLVSSVYTYINYGMESGLFSALVGLSLVFRITDRRVLLWLTLGLTWLTRPEGVLLVGVVVLHELWRQRRFPPLRLMAIPVALYSLQLILNRIYYGTFMSVSATAKLEQARSGYWAHDLFVDYMYENHVEVIFANQWTLVLVLIFLGGLGLLRCRNEPLRSIALLFLLGFAAFFQLFRFPPQMWYYPAYYLFAWVFVAVGLAWLVEHFRTIQRKTLRAWLVGGTLAFVPWTVYQFGDHTYAMRGHSSPAYRDIGNWLRENTAEDAVIALAEIGTVGWYSERRIVDILGLVSPPNAEYVGRGDFQSWMKHYHADYVLIHDPIWNFEQDIKSIEEQGGFEPVEGFHVAGYRLLRPSPHAGENNRQRQPDPSR